MAATERRPSRERLSVQTLVIAAMASAAAAIMTSTFWRGGTIIAAAMTPVIVSIVKELLARPMESDLVKRPVERVRAAAPAPTGVRRFERRPRERVAAERVAAPSGPATRPPRGAGAASPGRERVGTPPGDGFSPTAAPMRTYTRRRRRHIGVAVATGLVAFAIALVALTVPELIFGGSVASHGSTTMFGGGQTQKATTNDHSGSNTTTTPGSSSSHTNTTPSTPKTSPQPSSPSHGQSPSTQSSPKQAPSTQSPSPSTPQSGGGATPPSK